MFISAGWSSDIVSFFCMFSHFVELFLYQNTSKQVSLRGKTAAKGIGNVGPPLNWKT